MDGITSRTIRDTKGNILFEVVVHNDKLGDEMRLLTIDQYVNWLAGCTKVERDCIYREVDMKKLPKTLLKLDMGDTPGEFKALFFLPESVGGCNFMGAPVRKIEPPRVILYQRKAAANDANCVSRSFKLFACNADIDTVNDDTELCCYPLGHWSRSGGVCRGSVNDGNVDTVYQCEEYFREFFNADNYGHSYQAEFTKSGLAFADLMQYLADADKFPRKELVPVGETLGNLWRNR